MTAATPASPTAENLCLRPCCGGRCGGGGWLLEHRSEQAWSLVLRSQAMDEGKNNVTPPPFATWMFGPVADMRIEVQGRSWNPERDVNKLRESIARVLLAP